MVFKVKKSNGYEENFESRKVIASIKKAGGDQKLGERVVDIIEKRATGHKGPVPTADIYKWTKEALGHDAPGTALRYSLRDALLKLGPTGFPFEKYIAALLAEYGYKTELPEMLKGACIEHEVDVTMEKDNRFMMAEAKFRKDPTVYISIKDTMSTWARFLDLVEGAALGIAPHFDEAWIVTNARFSDQSLKYGHCKNMVMLGWNHPKERNLANMIDLKKLYPVTILESLTPKLRDYFFENNILLASQIPNVLSGKNVPVSEEKKQQMQREAAILLSEE